MHLALPSSTRETPVSNDMQPLTLQTTPTGEASAARASLGVSDPSSPFDDDVDDLADESDFDETRPVLNTIEDLKKGIVQTKDKGRSEYTILLVGETGTGKSSLLAFIANVLAGNSLSKYDFATIDQDNERGVSQKESQTKYAKLYEFRSQNDIKVNVLDTPGLADTRGIQQDELHKKGIATEIKEQVTTVHAVLILANGTLPRLSVSTEYALTTLSSIFPKSLADNISLVFTMCSNPLSINFTDDAVPPSLETAPQLYIDNPLSLLHKYLEMKANGQHTRQLRAAREHVVSSEAAALQTMVRFFDWLDDLKPQPTTDILTLFNKSQTIQQQISNTISQMAQAQDKSEEIKRLIRQIEFGQADIDVYSKFEQSVETKIWRHDPTDYHNTLCAAPRCYSVCHELCQLDFSLDPEKLRKCWAMEGFGIFFRNATKCRVCQHPVEQHAHWRAVWKEHDETQISVDEGMKAKWESAKDGKAKDEAALEAMRQALADVERVVERKMVKLADLAEEYGKMSLSGSFSAHLERGITLMEMHLASSRESNTDSKQKKRLEENVEELKRKLDVLKKANSIKQGAKNLRKGWDRGWDLANRAIKWTTGAGPTAAPAGGK
ncbi:hypothetical protein DFH07DRAFT_1034072 [Mycena maculata]|uniref:AIG1-type G domain-containing protein n=1 Tax=Mycena maculata TaxID=230809 RepID=A0AAD7IUF5_9AGAR|nr:hypothetical protein DFH07DRAFT_1034072 [Mycena maculata]